MKHPNFLNGCTLTGPNLIHLRKLVTDILEMDKMHAGITYIRDHSFI